MKIFYSDKYEVDIGGHVFPTKKYRLVKDKLIRERTADETSIVEPIPATEEQILLVHTAEWFSKMRDEKLTVSDEMKLELPYSSKLYEASTLCVGGTISACREALKKGVGIHLGGGFHHAFPDHGEGFCVFNDIAVAIRQMQKEKRIKKAVVVDLDVHQGNGTAFIFRDDPSVFTFSMHQENNYPGVKPPSNWDIGLADGTSDKEYLTLLKNALRKILSEHHPDILVYQAGADTYAGDQLGGLKVSLAGMAERDRIVFEESAKKSIPYAVTLGGGYAHNLDDTVTIHTNTIKLALNTQTNS